MTHQRFRLESLHADGRVHRSWPEVWETPDPWTFLIRPGSPVVEADGRRWASDYPVLAVFWPDRWYQLFVLLKSAGTEYYCNVIRPPIYYPGSRTVQFVDLDLDVYVDTDVRLLDESEFEMRASQYPLAWQQAAREAAEELVRLAKDRAGPFDPAAAWRWRAWAEGRTGVAE